MKVKASSNFWCVPSQTNLHLRMSMSGLKTSAKVERDARVQPVGGDDEVVRFHVGPGLVDLGLED